MRAWRGRIVLAVCAVLLTVVSLSAQGCASSSPDTKQENTQTYDTKTSTEPTSAVGKSDGSGDASGGMGGPATGGEQLYTASYEPTGKEIAVFVTSKGTFKTEFYPSDAPNTVAAFIELIESKYFDGVKFHRVEPGFVVQGGDPITRDMDPQAVRDVVTRMNNRAPAPGDPPVGTGGPGYVLKGEFNKRSHIDGTLAMARSDHPDSAGSQFYVCLGPQPFLDGQYTVFGQVTEGMDVVRSIAVGDVIKSVKIEKRK